MKKKSIKELQDLRDCVSNTIYDNDTKKLIKILLNEIIELKRENEVLSKGITYIVKNNNGS